MKISKIGILTIKGQIGSKPAIVYVKYNLQFSFLTGFIMIRELGCTFKNITNMVRNIFLYLINKARNKSEKLGVHLF